MQILLVCKEYIELKIIISKEAEVRKKELASAAMKLFLQKGYNNTSIDDINKVVGVTKGAFYYHFKSKEDILEKVVTRLSEKTIKITEDICSNKSMNAIEKLNKLLERVYEHRIKNQKQYKELFKIAESDTNLVFKKRVWNQVFEKVKKPYVKLLNQGIQEGVFKTKYPEEIYEVVMILSDFYRKSLVRLYFDPGKKSGNIEIMKRKAIFLQTIMENQLGLQAGMLNVAEQMLKPFNIKPD